jgi:hypothetical protein
MISDDIIGHGIRCFIKRPPTDYAARRFHTGLSEPMDTMNYYLATDHNSQYEFV